MNRRVLVAVFVINSSKTGTRNEFVLGVKLNIGIWTMTITADRLLDHNQQVSMIHTLVIVMLLLHHQDQNRRFQTEFYVQIAKHQMSCLILFRTGTTVVLPV